MVNLITLHAHVALSHELCIFLNVLMMGLRPLSRTFLSFQGGRWSSITRYSGSRSGVVQNLAIEPNLPLYCDICLNFLPLNSNEVDVVCFLWICFGIY